MSEYFLGEDELLGIPGDDSEKKILRTPITTRNKDIVLNMVKLRILSL